MSSDSLNELKNQFLGRSDNNDLIDNNSPYLKNNSNFMQGILHYTSSIIHSSHCLWLNRLCASIFPRVKKSEDDEFIRMSQVSSDDFGFVMSIVFSSNHDDVAEKYLWFKGVLELYSNIIKNSYPLFGALVSDEKSVLVCFHNIYEFNSFWFVKNTLLEPKIKWFVSTSNIRPESSCYDRMNTDYTLFRDMVKHGISNESIAAIESSCAINHYITMGMLSESNSTWNLVSLNMSDKPHPMFFNYIPSMWKCSFYFGLESTLFYNDLKNDKTLRYHYLFKNSATFNKSISDEQFNIKLNIGDSRKYKKFMLDLNLEKDEIEKSCNNPRSLYVSDTSIDSLLFRLKLKTISPGVRDSFMYVSPMIAIRSSAYIIRNPCITIKESNDQFNKCNLIYLLQKEYPVSKKYIPNDSDVFLNVYEYSKNCVPMIYHFKKKSIKIQTWLSNSYDKDVSLMNCVKWKWFNEDKKNSLYMMNKSWNNHKENYSWLKDDYESTLDSFTKHTGKEGHLSLYYAITSIMEKNMNVEVLTKGRRKPQFVDQIKECMKNDSFRSKKLLFIDDVIKPTEASIQQNINELECALGRLKVVSSMNFCYTDVIASLFKNFSNSVNNLSDTDIITRMQNRYHPLFLMSRLMKYEGKLLNNVESSKIFDLMMKFNQGQLMWYEQMQKLIDGRYCGTGVINLIIGSKKFKLIIKDDKLVELIADNIASVMLHKVEINSCFKALGITSSDLIYAEAGVVIKDKKMTIVYGKPSSPIRIQQVMIGEPNNLRFRFDKNKNTGNLTLFSSIRGMQVENLKFNPRTLNEQVSLETEDDFLNHWVNNKRMDLELCDTVISDNVQLSSDLIKNRLIRLRKISNPRYQIITENVSSVDVEAEDDFDADLFAKEMDDIFDNEDLFSDDVLCLNEVLQNEEDLELDDMFMMGIDDMSDFQFLLPEIEYVAQKSEIAMEYAKETIVWDDLISYLEDSYGLIQNWTQIPDEILDTSLGDCLLLINIKFKENVIKPKVKKFNFRKKQ